MLYVDGMNGVISHPETIQWLYTLVGSKVEASKNTHIASFVFLLSCVCVNQVCQWQRDLRQAP